MQIAWRVSDLPEALAALPEASEGATGKERTVGKLAKALYNAAVLAGLADPESWALRELRRKGLVADA